MVRTAPVVTSEFRRIMPHHQLVLSLRHRVYTQVEWGGDGDDVLRPLVGPCWSVAESFRGVLGLGRTHAEAPGWEEGQLHADAVDESVRRLAPGSQSIRQLQVISMQFQ